jgi:uncharacterized protein (DUF2147 family)
MGAAKSQLKARAKGVDPSVSERPASPRQQSVVDRSDDRPASRRDEPVSTPAKDTAKDTPVKDTVAAPKKDPVFTNDAVNTKDTAVPAEAKTAAAAAPAPVAAEAVATYDPKSPIGEWVTEDGEGRVRIRACGQALCGVISSGDPNETDRHNPDVNKRNRPLLGTPVLIDMKSVNSKRWEGEIYNAKNGKTYASNIMLKSADVLRVEGCVFGGFFCGGQDWVRAKDAPRG